MFKKDPPNKKIILAAEISDINIVKTKKAKIQDRKWPL